MKHRILVVEDNQPNRELLGDWLESEGFEVVAAENLKQGYAVLKNQPPDAVLLDIQLGQEDGLSLVRWIRQEEKLRHIPVIAVTAHAMVTDHQRVMEAGCNACLAKPVDFKSLGKRLEQWLNHTAKIPFRA
jgi:two-component system cell cycle response regulator DivK